MDQFEALLLPQVDALHRTAYRLIGDAASAQDLVQETSLKAYRSFRQFDLGTNFRAWIFAILTNTFINEYRRRCRGPVPVDFAEGEPLEPEEVHLSPDEIAPLQDRIGDEASKALEKVPPSPRLVFLLATFERMSYKEIAEIIGSPIGTVMSRLFRARAILRKHLFEFARESGFVKEGRSP
jgi:RNA polymerase sigma-70 factor (ECF subfamily)